MSQTTTTLSITQNSQTYPTIYTINTQTNPSMMNTSKSNKMAVAPKYGVAANKAVVPQSLGPLPIQSSHIPNSPNTSNPSHNSNVSKTTHKSSTTKPDLSKIVSNDSNINHTSCKPFVQSRYSNKGYLDYLDDNFDDNNKCNINKFDPDLEGIPEWIINLMEYQPTLNIMTIGDVNHGKSTLMWGLCDEKTGRHSSEIKKNATIKLGYTSCKIFKCINCYLSNQICYFSGKSTINIKQIKCPKCNQKQPFVKLIRHVSFVDCPGHAEYMGTMISAACVADGAIMVIDASREFPGLQTVQHTSAAHQLGVLTNSSTKQYYSNSIGQFSNNPHDGRIKVIVAQNKIDLIKPDKACRNVEEIRSFLHGYDPFLSYSTPIIPISAQSRLNLDALCMTMVRNYPKYSPRLDTPDSHNQTNININNINLTLSVSRRSLRASTVPRGLNIITEVTEEKSDEKLNELLESNESLNELETSETLEMNIIRSFDVNKQCEMKSIEDIDKMYHGGVCGGVIIKGTLSIGDTVCIRPGIVTTRLDAKMEEMKDFEKLSIKEQYKLLIKPKFTYRTLEAKVIGLKCGTKSLKEAYPGANVGVMLNIDPCLTKCDQRVGDVICGINGNNLNKLLVFNVFRMSFIPLSPYEDIKITPMEIVKINIGAAKVNGRIVKRVILGNNNEKRKRNDDRNENNNNNKENNIKGIEIVLERPICGKVSSKVSLTRKINNTWRLGAAGIIFAVRQCVSVEKLDKKFNNNNNNNKRE